MREKKLTKQLFRLTDGLIGSVTDFLLLYLFFGFNILGRRTSYEMNRAIEETYELLDQVNYKTIKKALYSLRYKGYTKYKFKKTSPKFTPLDLEITNLGTQKLQSIAPTYYTKRPWDGYVYLISYDVPTQANKIRNLLRNFIQKNAGVLLQESLWLTPYNPSLLLKEFAQSHNIPGTILVSKLGKNGSIGEEDLTALIVRVYKLEDLAQRYQTFINKYEHFSNKQLRFVGILDYLSILKDDPQLPFELLPKDYPAAYAYSLFIKISNLKY